jgi:Tfp pilus assembly protein PilF
MRLGCARGVLAALLFVGSVQAQEALRPDVGKPLQAAQELVKAGKYKEALAKVRDADAVPNKNANESFTIERMRLAAASGAGEVDVAAKAFDAISSSPRVAGADKLRMIESIAGSYYRAKDYPRAMQWYQRYFREGGTSAANRSLLIQTQYLGGDFAGVVRELTAEIQADEKAGTPPAEDRLKMLLNAALKLGDNSANVFAMEKLVTHYPKKEYWTDLLSRMTRKPGFSDRLVLDTFRLSLATGSMSAAADYMEMAQLALQAGLPLEGKQVVDKGFAAGVLGSGAEAERHKRLRDLVMKKLAEEESGRADAQKLAAAEKDGGNLVNLGFNLVFGGQAPQGLALMQQGLAKGNLKHADDAKLHLAIAQMMAGDTAKAQASFKTVAGGDGTADLARLWSLYVRRKG